MLYARLNHGVHEMGLIRPVRVRRDRRLSVIGGVDADSLLQPRRLLLETGRNGLGISPGGGDTATDIQFYRRIASRAGKQKSRSLETRPARDGEALRRIAACVLGSTVLVNRASDVRAAKAEHDIIQRLPLAVRRTRASNFARGMGPRA